VPSLKSITEAKTIHFNNQIKTSNEVNKAWKIKADSTGKSQLYYLVNKITLKLA
jgi:hypothetical protein